MQRLQSGELRLGQARDPPVGVEGHQIHEALLRLHVAHGESIEAAGAAVVAMLEAAVPDQHRQGRAGRGQLQRAGDPAEVYPGLGVEDDAVGGRRGDHGQHRAGRNVRDDEVVAGDRVNERIEGVRVLADGNDVLLRPPDTGQKLLQAGVEHVLGRDGLGDEGAGPGLEGALAGILR